MRSGNSFIILLTTKENPMATKTIEPKKKSQKPIKFQEGGLHKSTGTKPGEKISAAEHAKAASGAEGEKAQRQERFYQNILQGHGGKKKAKK